MIKSDRRDFLKKTGLGLSALAVGGAPAVHANSKKKIVWKLQTYANEYLAQYVIKPSIEFFNKAANGEMEIELYYADQIVPTTELFKAMRNGIVDAVQADDQSISSPADVAVFSGYFPFAFQSPNDVPALFHHWGLNEVWQEAYQEAEGVSWLGSGSWDPCHISTTKPVKKLDDLRGMRLFTSPSFGGFLSRFGITPVDMPLDDVLVSLQTGTIHGTAWSGITECHTLGWADHTKYFLTNPISGAWCGSYFANSEKWYQLPEHLKVLFNMCIATSHYSRSHWYWSQEMKLRADDQKLTLTTVNKNEWVNMESSAHIYWDEVSRLTPRTKRVIEILRQYKENLNRAQQDFFN